MEEYSDAITHFEAARARKLTSQQDLISLYWLFQAQLKKGNQELAKTLAEDLVARFPITLYGLQAYVFLNQKLPEFLPDNKKNLKIKLSSGEQWRLDRAKA
jgi:outer membrane protein assembly factor BamD (BamD/ComL family)